MRGTPHITPVAMRTVAGRGEFRGEPRGIAPAAAAAGGLRERPNGSVAPGAAERDERNGERSPRAFGRSEPGHSSVATNRSGAAQYGHSEGGRGVRSEAFRGEAGQFGRPQVFQGSAEGYRGGAQQFGRPEVSQGFRGGVQQFGRPQVAQGFRGGAQQFGRPQVFQTPVASYRGGGMMGRATPTAHFDGGGGGGGRRK
jgi:hypothetical protein